MALIHARNQTDQPQYVSLQRAAEIWDCSVRTVRRRISAGEIQARRLGSRSIRVSLEDVLDFGQPVPTFRGNWEASPRTVHDAWTVANAQGKRVPDPTGETAARNFDAELLKAGAA